MRESCFDSLPFVFLFPSYRPEDGVIHAVVTESAKLYTPVELFALSYIHTDKYIIDLTRRIKMIYFLHYNNKLFGDV